MALRAIANVINTETPKLFIMWVAGESASVCMEADPLRRVEATQKTGTSASKLFISGSVSISDPIIFAITFLVNRARLFVFPIFSFLVEFLCFYIIPEVGRTANITVLM